MKKQTECSCHLDSPCQWCIENLDENGEVIEKDDD